jgi:4-amino-4-deoxy-L-arabinose transferase-like glycosyltransferase
MHISGQTLVGSKPSALFWGGALFVLLGAALWWASFLTQGAPFVYHPDEPAVMARAIAIVDTGRRNPGWFNYPSLVIYLQSAVAALVSAFGRVPLAPGAQLLFEGAPAGALPFYVWGRALTLAFALGTTTLTMLMARRLTGPWLGLLAGAVFASSTLVLRSAVYVTVDMPLTFFTTLSVFLLMRLAEDPDAGGRITAFLPPAFAASLSAGAKYNGSLVLLVVAGLWIARAGFGRSALLKLGGLALFSIATFVATTPYSLLDPASFWSEKHGIVAEILHYRTGHLGADTGLSAEKALDTLFHSVGPAPFLAVFALGFVAARGVSRVRRAQTILLFCAVAVLLSPVVLARVYFERNCLPVVPLLLVLAAAGLLAAVRRCRTLFRTPPAPQLAVGAVLALPFVLQVRAARGELAPYVLEKNREDTRTTAFRWAVQNLPQGSRILREAFTPHLHLVEGFAVTSHFSAGALPVSEIEGAYDYLVTSSTIWQAHPDLNATSYPYFFQKPALYEIAAGHASPAVRIHQLRRIEPRGLDAGLVFRLSGANGFANVSPVADVELRVPERGNAAPLEVRALGLDPGLLLPPMPLLGARFFLLRVELTSPHPTTLQAFYLPRGAAQFNEENSARAPIARGLNRVDLRLGFFELTGHVRLDPGEKPGLYRIESVALYALPEQPHESAPNQGSD